MLAKYLFSEGFCLCSTTKNSQVKIPILTAAVYAGNAEIIEEFVKQNIHTIDYYTPHRCNPICAAIAADKSDILSYLIQKGIIYYPCPYHKNILITELKYLKIILLSTNLFKIKLNNLYEAAQYYICFRKVEEAREVIAFIGARAVHKESSIIFDKELLAPYMHATLLVLATEKKLFSIVELLVSYGYDVNIGDKGGRHAFIESCACGAIEFIKLFHANGAMVNNKDALGRTGLHFAAGNGHRDAVRVILECGGDSCLICDKGETPLDYAIRNNRVGVISILQSHGSKSMEGKSPANSDISGNIVGIAPIPKSRRSKCRII